MKITIGLGFIAFSLLAMIPAGLADGSAKGLSVALKNNNLAAGKICEGLQPL